MLAVLAWAAVHYIGIKFSLLSKWRPIALSVVVAVFVIAGKSFYSTLMRDGFSEIPTWWENMSATTLLKGAEFLNTSSILQEVIINVYSVPFLVTLSGVLSATPLPLSLFGLISSLFNELFQADLFPNIDYGMAYNPWAEAYAAWGFFGVFVYSLTFPILMILFERIYLRFKFSPIGSVFLILALLLAFWIHRNSAGSIFAYLRNAFYPSVICLLLAMPVYLLLARLPPKSRG